MLNAGTYTLHKMYIMYVFGVNCKLKCRTISCVTFTAVKCNVSNWRLTRGVVLSQLRITCMQNVQWTIYAGTRYPLSPSEPGCPSPGGPSRPPLLPPATQSRQNRNLEHQSTCQYNFFTICDDKRINTITNQISDQCFSARVFLVVTKACS